MVVVLYSELHRMIKELLLWLQALNNSVQCKLSNMYCVKKKITVKNGVSVIKCYRKCCEFVRLECIKTNE